MHTIRNPDGSRQFASGRNLKQRCRDIRAMFPAEWVCWSIDCSSYDGSQGELAVWERQMCLGFAKVKGFEHLKDIERVLKGQDRLNIRAEGLTASIYGNRASGTAGTSVANKLVMIAALKHAMCVSYNAGEVKFYCDGDDTLIFVSPAAVQYEASWMRRLKRLGLDVVVENRARTVEEIVFCRSKPFDFGGENEMLIKRPEDAFKTMCGVVRHFKGDCLADYFATMRDGYARMWRDVPVMHALADIFGTAGRINSRMLSSDDRYKFKDCLEGAPFENRITLRARANFNAAFGISPSCQIEIEKLCRDVGSQMPALVNRYVRARKIKITHTY